MANVYEVYVKGVSDMLQNRLSRELNKEISQIPRGEREEWQDENWKKKLYTMDIEGEEKVIWPSINIHSFLQAACKKYKVPPPNKDLGRTWTSYFNSCVIVTEPSIIEYEEIIPFSQMVNGNPSSGKKSSKVYSVRPLIRGWQTKMVFMDTEGFLTKEIVEEIVTKGGKFVGLSDWRPVYGRFTVTEIKVSGDE